MSNGKSFVVERVLKKRLFGRKKEVQFLLKWKGYKRPTWTSAEQMSCDELVREFETPKINGATRDGNKIVYSIDVEDKKGQLVTAEKMDRYRDILIDFLESVIEWVEPDSSAPSGNDEDVDWDEACEVGAEKVLYATKSVQKLVYLVQFGDRKCKFVSAAEARKKYAPVLLNFLEGHLI